MKLNGESGEFERERYETRNVSSASGSERFVDPRRGHLEAALRKWQIEHLRRFAAQGRLRWEHHDGGWRDAEKQLSPSESKTANRLEGQD